MKTKKEPILINLDDLLEILRIVNCFSMEDYEKAIGCDDLADHIAKKFYLSGIKFIFELDDDNFKALIRHAIYKNEKFKEKEGK